MAYTRAEKTGNIGFGTTHARQPLTEKDKAENLNAMLEPGMLVRHPGQPGWGLGQVQSNIGGRVTVNFEHGGKVTIDGRRIELVTVYDP